MGGFSNGKQFGKRREKTIVQRLFNAGRNQEKNQRGNRRQGRAAVHDRYPVRSNQLSGVAGVRFHVDFKLRVFGRILKPFALSAAGTVSHGSF